MKLTKKQEKLAIDVRDCLNEASEQLYEIGGKCTPKTAKLRAWCAEERLDVAIDHMRELRKLIDRSAKRGH